MAFLPSSLLLLIYAASQLPQPSLAFPSPRREANTTFQLSTQLKNFVPRCAQPCFISFLNLNFDAATLGASPDLDTLCSHNSTSGYTIGEGAVECIVGEDSAEACSKTGVGDEDGSAAKISSAYGMCIGQKGALSNTHATIVATLSTSGSVVLIAPLATPSTSTTSKTSATTTRSRTTSFPATITAPPPTVASTVPITVASGSATVLSTSSSSIVQTTVLSAAAISSSSTKSKAPKIAGIAVGSLAGVAFAVGLCVFLRRLRKRRNRDRDSDIFPFTPESTNSLAARRFTQYSRQQGNAEKGQGSPGFAPGGTRNGVAAKVSPTFYPRNVTPTPERRPTIRLVDDRNTPPTTRASGIGLAISAEPSPATLSPPPTSNDAKHSSKLLPEKPTLALKIPSQTYPLPGQVFNFPSPPRSQNSIMNRPRPKINFGPPRSQTSQQRQYNPGNGRESGNTLSTDFQPYLLENTTPYYPENVTTPYKQNMALRKYLASEQNLHVRPLDIRRDTEAQSPQSRRGYSALSNTQYPFSQSYNRGMMMMKNNFSNSTRPRNTYQPNSVIIRPPPKPQTPTPPTKRSHNAQYQHRPSLPRDSTGSATSFESFSSGDDIEAMSPGGTITIKNNNNNNNNNNTNRKSHRNTINNNNNNNNNTNRKSHRNTINNNNKDLSPVKESPSPARTPVSYPKIPGRLGSTVRMIPPPARPDFTKVMGSGSSVVIRKPLPPIGGQGQGQKPWRQAELVAAKERRRSIYGDNSNNQSLASSEREGNAVVAKAYSTLPSQRTGGFPSSMLQSQGQGQNQNRGQNQQGFLLKPTFNPRRSSDRISTASTNSSLLTERRGEKLAADLVLNGNHGEANNDLINTPGSGSAAANPKPNPGITSKWRVLREAEEDTGWRRQRPLNSNPSHVHRVSRDLFLDSDHGEDVVGSGKENLVGGYEGQGGRGQLGQGEGVGVPGTPGWKPRLTPTRRGDELFLSVQ